MTKKESRRNFLKVTSLGILAAPLTSKSLFSEPMLWKNQQKKISSEISGEQTVGVKLNIKDYGAVGDGITNDTTAIQQTLNRCWVFGGGEVIVPAGQYLTGAVSIKSNTILRMEKGAVIKGTPDFEDYPVMQVRWEGKWIEGRTALIYAVDAENIGISGPGKIVGNPALGGRPNERDPLRHPALIEMIGCKNIYLEDFSTEYSWMWCIHPTYCEHVYIKNLTIRSMGGNGDGIDIDSCRHVRIDNCDIETGDDCIAIKSGRGMEGYSLQRTTEDVLITNCILADSIFACIGIGSESSGGIRNITITDCRFTGAKTFAIYIKSRPGRGAFIEDIHAENLDVSGMQGGFLRFNTLGSGIRDQDPVLGMEGIPSTKHFTFRNIRVHDVPVLVEGTSIHPDKPLEGFELSNISGTCKQGITLANIRNAKLENINVKGFEGPPISVFNVTGTGLKDAVQIEAPKVPEAVMPGEVLYKLH